MIKGTFPFLEVEKHSLYKDTVLMVCCQGAGSSLGIE